MHILFVCQANMCRSAMAEAIARKLAEERELPERVVVRSAGLWTVPGMAAVPEAVAAGAEHGARIEEHETTPFSLGVADRADYIVAMTRAQKAEILLRLPMLKSRTFTLAEFVHELTGRWPRWRDVDDPIGRGPEEFRRCARLLYEALSSVFDVLAGKKPRHRGWLARLRDRR